MPTSQELDIACEKARMLSQAGKSLELLINGFPEAINVEDQRQAYALLAEAERYISDIRKGIRSDLLWEYIKAMRKLDKLKQWAAHQDEVGRAARDATDCYARLNADDKKLADKYTPEENF